MEEYVGYRVWSEDEQYYDDSGGQGWVLRENEEPQEGDFVFAQASGQVRPWAGQSQRRGRSTQAPSGAAAEAATRSTMGSPVEGTGSPVEGQRARRGAASGDAARAAAARANPLGDKVQGGIATVLTQADFQTALGMQGLTRIVIPQNPEELISVAGQPPQGVAIELSGPIVEINVPKASVIVNAGVEVPHLIDGDVTIKEGGRVNSMTGGYAWVYGVLENVDSADVTVEVKSRGEILEVTKAMKVMVSNGGKVARVKDGYVELDGPHAEITESVSGGVINIYGGATARCVSQGEINIGQGKVYLASDVENINVREASGFVSAPGLEIEYGRAELFQLFSSTEEKLHRYP